MAVLALANRSPDGSAEAAIQSHAVPRRMHIDHMSWAFDRIRQIVRLVNILMKE